MKKGDVIGGFRILEDFRVAGGMSKVTFAERGGKEYFIKEFLSPKYPTSDSPGSEKIKAQKRKACESFEKHHRELNKLISTKVSLGGNLVYAIDFFREGASYYKINEKIDTTSLSLKEIASLPFEKICVIAGSVCHSVGILHDLGIVHGDLKPENILIKKTSANGLTGKLIDFDDSYFSQRPPTDKECIVGTPEYYSPELAAYLMDEDEEISGETLTIASDIFTLGIILCEYFTGEKPIVVSGKPIWSAVTNGESVVFPKKINPAIENLLRSMLSLNPSERPLVKKIGFRLREIKEGGVIGKSTDTPKTSTSLRFGGKEKKGIAPIEETLAPTTRVRLRGKGLNIKD